MNDETLLPAQGPHGEAVTVGSARAFALNVLAHRESTDDERVLAKLVLAFIALAEGER